VVNSKEDASSDRYTLKPVTFAKNVTVVTQQFC
jgi:hypothetical protein